MSTPSPTPPANKRRRAMISPTDHYVPAPVSHMFGLQTSQPKPWAPIRVSLQVLSNGDAYRPLLIEAFSWKKWVVDFCWASRRDVVSCRATYFAPPSPRTDIYEATSALQPALCDPFVLLLSTRTCFSLLFLSSGGWGEGKA